MDIELKKIKTPFSPNEQYFVDLASRIQKKVGIEVEEIRQESPKLDLNKKARPLQLTVEFGYPLTAEKNVPEESTFQLIEEVIDIVSQPTVELIEIESTAESIEIVELTETIAADSIAKDSMETLAPIETIEAESINTETTHQIAEEVVEFGRMDISETVVSPYFSDADLDRLHEQMHLEQSKQKQTTPVEFKDSAETLTSSSDELNINSSELNVVSEVANVLSQEPLVKSPGAVDFENAFTDAELDMLHEMHSKQDQASKAQTVTANASFTQQSHVVSNAATSPEKIEKTIQIPSDSKVIDRDNQAASIKPSLLDMIPWSTVFGLVASLMAVASAWFIWNSIQKPIAIDAMIDQAVVTTPAAVQTAENVEVIEEGIQIDELTPSQQVTYEWVENPEDNKASKTQKFDFKKLNEKSKISSVELEKNGLTVLELEDAIFDEVTL